MDELMTSIAKHCEEHKAETRRLLGVECLRACAGVSRRVAGMVLEELTRIATGEASATVRVAVVRAVASTLDAAPPGDFSPPGESPPGESPPRNSGNSQPGPQPTRPMRSSVVDRRSVPRGRRRRAHVPGAGLERRGLQRRDRVARARARSMAPAASRGRASQTPRCPSSRPRSRTRSGRSFEAERTRGGGWARYRARSRRSRSTVTHRR